MVVPCHAAPRRVLRLCPPLLVMCRMRRTVLSALSVHSLGTDPTPSCASSARCETFGVWLETPKVLLTPRASCSDLARYGHGLAHVPYHRPRAPQRLHREQRVQREQSGLPWLCFLCTPCALRGASGLCGVSLVSRRRREVAPCGALRRRSLPCLALSRPVSGRHLRLRGRHLRLRRLEQGASVAALRPAIRSDT